MCWSRFIAIGFLLWSASASALQVSPGALRIEDKKSGNLLLGAENSALEAGESFHTVLLLWGNLDVYGTADEVVVLSGHVTFHEGSKLNKSLTVMGGSYEAVPGSSVANENIIFRSPGPLWGLLKSAVAVWRENFSWVLAILASAFSVLFFWLFGFILFSAFPPLRGILGKLERDWAKNLFVGVFGACLVPAFFVLMVISLLGILLTPLLFLSLLLSAMVSYSGAALWLGQRLLTPKKRDFRPLSLLLGLVIFQVLWLMGSWGFFLALLIWTLSWGALLRSLRLLWK